MWRETPIPMYLEIYMFNWTNAEQYVLTPSIKPIFNECGPYTFYEHHTRENITFNDNNTLTYFTKRTWRFLPEKSAGSLDDVVITLNPILAVSIKSSYFDFIAEDIAKIGEHRLTTHRNL